MENLLREIARSDSRETAALIRLIALIRPKSASHLEQAANSLLALCYLLEQDAYLREGLRSYLLRVIGTRKQSHLYSDTGIFDGTGFFTELSQRLNWKLLPPAINDEQFKDIFSQLFHRFDDWEWVTGLEDSLWLRLIAALHFEEVDAQQMPRQPELEILKAITTLSHRLTALGLEPDLLHVHPAIESYESPFLALNSELQEYVQQYHAYLDRYQEQDTHLDDKQALVLMSQCRSLLQKIRKGASETGISIRLTQTMVRMRQIMDRLEKLLREPLINS